jgi:hypothetical protein
MVLEDTVHLKLYGYRLSFRPIGKAHIPVEKLISCQRAETILSDCHRTVNILFELLLAGRDTNKCSLHLDDSGVT